MKLRFLFKPAVSMVLCSLFIGLVLLPADAKKRHDSATVEPTELHLKEGMRLMKGKDYEGAADEFLQACYFSRNNYCPKGWLYLGLCYKAQRNYPKAIDALTKHLAQTTEKACDAHVDLAECYLNIGEYDKAEKQITQARIDAENNNPRPWYAMGELYEKMNRPGDAMEAYNTALGDRPYHFIEAWMGKARCLIKLTPPRYNEALREYKDIIDSAIKDVDWVELYYNMAMCLYKRGDHQGAIDHLLEALKTNPDHFESHLTLAHIFDEEKHITSAINQYEHALRTAAKNADTEAINKRIVYLQAQLKEDERDKVVKPSPYMRQQEQEQQQAKPKQKGIPQESGF